MADPSMLSGQTYDAAPDLLRLWAALERCNARLEPMDALAVVCVRGGGQRFETVAESFRCCGCARV